MWLIIQLTVGYWLPLDTFLANNVQDDHLRFVQISG